jgi:hypothetical protein
MTLSPEGLLVFLGLLLLGRLAGNATIIGMFASLAFGATAAATIPALGNASPLIYTLFGFLLVLQAASQPHFFAKISFSVATSFSSFVAIVLAFWAVASAIILPRLFIGEFPAFVPVDGVVLELPLAPVGGNITQTAYLLLGVASFFSLRILLFDFSAFRDVRKALFAYVIVHAVFGLFDLSCKVLGTDDWLLSIKTASYALLDDDQVDGFARIVGTYSEASSFAINSLACVSFSYTYWRCTGSKTAFVLTLLITFLLLRSTSTTAYVGLTLLSLFAVGGIALRLVIRSFGSKELILLVIWLSLITCLLCIYLADEHTFDAFQGMLRQTLLEKRYSSSAEERYHFNTTNLQTFIDTYGLGIGMGSSRSSSWFISVLTQLGIFGALLFGVLIAGIFFGTTSRKPPNIFPVIAGARAMALGWLVGNSIAGSSADPGIQFFLTLAVAVSCKQQRISTALATSESLAPLTPCEISAIEYRVTQPQD